MEKIYTLIITMSLSFVINSLYAQKLVSVEKIDDQTVNALNTSLLFAGVSTTEFKIYSDISSYKIIYTSKDLKGNEVNVSGLLVIPTDILGPKALICYQHGTTNGANDVPSSDNQEAFLIKVLAAKGYIAFAPDYLGMGENSNIFHPYLHADSESWVAQDLLAAVRTHLTSEKIEYSGDFYVTGYSQGGHAAMSLQKDIEANPIDGITLKGSVPMSGPYDMSAVIYEELNANPPYTTLNFLPYIFMGLNEAYELYTDRKDFFDPIYLSSIEKFYNNTISRTDFETELNDIMTKAGKEISVKNLLKTEIVTKMADKTATNPLYKAFLDNNVYQFTPTVPTKLLYCSGDQTVSPNNSHNAYDYLVKKSPSLVSKQDIGDRTHGACIIPAAISGTSFLSSFNVLTSILEESLPDQVSVYPNPIHSSFNIQGTSGWGTLSMIDINGREVFNKKIQLENTFKKPEGLKGVFILKIETQKGVHLQKVIFE